jgi:putative transposase
VAARKRTPGTADLPIGGLSSASSAPLSVGIPVAAEGNTQLAIQENGVPGPLWRTRGYLPHFENGAAVQHVTFHLADSLPQSTLQRLETEMKYFPGEKRDAGSRKRLDAWFDAGHGSCIVRDPAMAGVAQSSLPLFDEKRHRLLAWVVTPNHVHVLLQPIDGWTVAKIVASWKKFTARKIFDHRRQTGEGAAGPVWPREFWDRYIRDSAHLARAIEYIHLNPVKVGLA